MSDAGFTCFGTANGRGGCAWGERGIRAVLFPERNEAAARARLLRKFPAASDAEPPPAIGQAVAGIVALLAGERRDLSEIRLDLDDVPAFHRRVYDIARSIGPGATLTYGEIAARLGEPNLARDVGQALGQNPFPIVVPCHRVLAAGGKLGGFSARGGVATERRLPGVHGARPPAQPVLLH